MTNSAATVQQSAHFITRSEIEAAATAAHRAEYLAKLTPKYVWLLLPLLAATINISFLWLNDPTALEYVVGFFGLCLCAYSALAFYRDDNRLRAIASLTPIYDVEAARAQIGVLSSAIKLLSEACRFNDAGMTKRSIEVVYSALAPILARGPATIETAIAGGYPPYPDIDITPMPGNPSDLITIHLLRLEACSTKIGAAANAKPGEMIFAETISLLAGEFVPPLRAIEAQLP